jgi:hypothetical protein
VLSWLSGPTRWEAGFPSDLVNNFQGSADQAH